MQIAMKPATVPVSIENGTVLAKYEYRNEKGEVGASHKAYSDGRVTTATSFDDALVAARQLAADSKLAQAVVSAGHGAYLITGLYQVTSDVPSREIIREIGSSLSGRDT